MTDQELKDIYQLKNIIRYNTRQRIKNESVAEHSFYVALMSLMICDEYDIDINITRDAIIKALLHDMPEIETNDITHDAKERLNIRKFLEKYEEDYYKRNFPKHLKIMTKPEQITATIVDWADSLSVKQYAMTEISLGNNTKDIQEIYEDAVMRCIFYKNKLENLL